MASGPGSANKMKAAPGAWLRELSLNVKSDGAPVRGRRLIPLKISSIALMMLVMPGPLMTIVEGNSENA